jgi:carboxylesterase
MARTGWEDWYAEVERAFLDLHARCDDVFVMGLSMGGTLSLRLAEVHGDRVRGLVLVNPSLLGEHPLLKAVPLLKHVLPSYKGIGSDIKKPGVTELAYGRFPTRAVASVIRLWSTTRADLDKVSVPVLLFRSAVDHVVEPSSGRALVEALGTDRVEERILHDSYHVATLDNDAPAIFQGSTDFVRGLLAGVPPRGVGGRS